jgi:hypothetical protein
VFTHAHFLDLLDKIQSLFLRRLRQAEVQERSFVKEVLSDPTATISFHLQNESLMLRHLRNKVRPAHHTLFVIGAGIVRVENKISAASG